MQDAPNSVLPIPGHHAHAGEAGGADGAGPAVVVGGEGDDDEVDAALARAVETRGIKAVVKTAKSWAVIEKGRVDNFHELVPHFPAQFPPFGPF